MCKNKVQFQAGYSLTKSLSINNVPLIFPFYFP